MLKGSPPKLTDPCGTQPHPGDPIACSSSGKMFTRMLREFCAGSNIAHLPTNRLHVCSLLPLHFTSPPTHFTSLPITHVPFSARAFFLPLKTNANHSALFRLQTKKNKRTAPPSVPDGIRKVQAKAQPHPRRD